MKSNFELLAEFWEEAFPNTFEYAMEQNPELKLALSKLRHPAGKGLDE